MTKFQTIFIAIFVVLTVGGVAAFALYKGNGEADLFPQITMWGTYDEETFTTYISNLNITRDEGLDIAYTYVEPEEFDQKFIEALARGEAPDTVLLPIEMVLKHEDKLLPIPYNTLPIRDYRNTFIDEAELYLTAEGALGFPLIIDPLVMYWNRDVFRTAGVATPPATWGDMVELIPKLTKKDLEANIQRSTLALGEYRNLDHAREILGTLIMQAGNPVTSREEGVVSSLGANTQTEGAGGVEESVNAVDFFVSFANPATAEYSWNRSLPTSRSFFTSGKLATYFGFASELRDIALKQPNLNFDVAAFPQPETTEVRRTYGRMWGISIVKQSLQSSAAYSVMNELLTPEALISLTELTYLPPVRRDLLVQGSTDPYLTIFYDSALISEAWLDPDINQTRSIFQEIVEAVTSGRDTVKGAIEDAHGKLQILLRNN